MSEINGLEKVAEQIESLARQSETYTKVGSVVEVAGRKYFRSSESGAFFEVHPVLEQRTEIAGLSGPDAVAAACVKWMDPKNTVVVVGKGGIVAQDRRTGEAKYFASPKVTAPYFTADDCPSKAMGVIEFLSWLDGFPGGVGLRGEGGVADYSTSGPVLALLGSLQWCSSDGVKIKRDGGLIQISQSGESSVKVDGSPATLPGYLYVKHRVGSRDFNTDVLYRLAIVAGKEGLVVTCQRAAACRAHDRFVDWAITRCGFLLPVLDGWCVVAGE